MADKEDKQYNELNEFLDECINEALQETTGKFQVGIDHSRDIDYEQFDESDRFKGFKKDKTDYEGEKMKDYERPPPFKAYRRPLSAEEERSYKQYEADMSNVKSGKERPNWDGYDKNTRGEDITEEWMNDLKQQKQKRRSPEHTRDTKTYSHPERAEDAAKGSYSFSTKTGSSRSFSEADLAQEKQNDQEHSRHRHVSRPKINPNLFQPPVETEETISRDKWTYPKFSNAGKNDGSTYQNTGTTERNRRHSDPEESYKPKFTSPEGFRSEGPYQTYENFYKTVAKSDLKPDYNKENKTPDSPPDGQAESEVEDDEKMLPGLNAEKVKKELLKLRPAITERAEWGALPPLGPVTPMKPPADTVVFTLNTGTSTCATEDECRRTVKEIQARHMGRGLEDIQYNFLVGGDGNLYEGRGWGYESGVKKEKNQGKSYNIAFIGNYQDNVEKIPPHMLGPVQELIIWGNAIRLITPETKNAGEYRFQQKEPIENK